MKRYVVIIACALLTMAMATTAEARRFGIKGGMNLSSTDFKAAAVTGYEVGVAMQFDLPLWFSIQPDLVYSVLGTSVGELQEHIGVGYVKLPVNVQWGPRFMNKNIRAFVQASPYVGYAVSQDLGLEWGDMDRFSYGAGLGIGVQLWFFKLTAQYNWNLGALENFKNTSIEDFDKSKVNGATIGVAFMFGKNK